MGLDPVVADPERVGLTGLKRRSADRHEHQQRRRIRLLVLLLLALAGCDGEEPPSADRTAPPSREERLNERLSGTVRVATAPVTQPFATGVAANFEDETPVEVEVTEVDSRAALARLCAGEVAMAAVDLPVVREGAGPARAGAIAFPDELRRSCRRNGVEPLRVDLGFLAVAVVASSELGLDCMSLAELRRVWRAGSPVHRYELYGAAPGTAAFELFAREVIGRGDGIRAGWTQVEDAATIRERLAADDKA
ncbi:MAG: substrate-binding domain-containing protein, partial [Thermoleophilaceae bacterium]